MIKKPRFVFWKWAMVVPLFGGVVLNLLVRPQLARHLGGVEITRGGSVRGVDRWWTFDEAVRADHPWMTEFLGLSDGQIGMLIFVLIAILLIGGGLVKAFRTSRHEPL